MPRCVGKTHESWRFGGYIAGEVEAWLDIDGEQLAERAVMWRGNDGATYDRWGRTRM
jgi:hypothetical protein